MYVNQLLSFYQQLGILLHRCSLFNQSFVILSDLFLFWYLSKCPLYLSQCTGRVRRVKWTVLCPLQVTVTYKPWWGSWPDSCLLKTWLMIAADATGLLAIECHGQCFGNAYLASCGSDTNCGSLSKETHSVTRERAPAASTLTPAMRWRRASLCFTPLAGWQSRYGSQNRSLRNTDLEGQLHIQLHSANLFPKNGSSENFSDTVVTICFKTSVLYLYFLRRVAQWAELCLALLPDFLKWEIEEKVTLMTFLLPEGSIKWYESNLHSNCNTSPSESLCPGGGEEHGSHINNEIQTHLLLNHRKVNSGYTITVGGGLIYWLLGQIILFSAAEATGNKSRGQGLCWQGP